MEIEVKNIDLFATLIYTVKRVVPGCKFCITPEGMNVYTINDSKTLRVLLETNAVVSKEPLEFCFQDLSKLYKSISMITNYNSVTTCKMDFDGVMLSYNSDLNFKLKTVKSDVIEKFVSKNVTTALAEVYSCIVDKKNIEMALENFSIVDSPECRVYIKEKDGKICCEAGDTSVQYADMINIPIATTYQGTFNKLACITLETFRTFFILNAPQTKITMTDRDAFKIESTLIGTIKSYDKVNKKDVSILDGTSVNMKLYCSTLKER